MKTLRFAPLAKWSLFLIPILLLFQNCSQIGTTPQGSNLSSSGPDASSGDSTGGTPGGGTPGGGTPGGGNTGGGGPIAGASVPAGWLFTSTNRIYVSKGDGTGTPWMGRGANMDDIFFCGGNVNLATSPNPGNLGITIGHFVTGATFKANFLRISLSMNSYKTENWVAGTPAPNSYQAHMTNMINTLATGSTYVLVALRSHSTMSNPAGNEAALVPTPNTDAVYKALVQSFANNGNVIFGLANEPGGFQGGSFATVTAAPLVRAANVIRAEEDRLGVPHHIISVQGDGYSRYVSYFANQPVKYTANSKVMDNVVYEVHVYSPIASSEVTYANIPIIIGEYGGFPATNGFTKWSDNGNTNPTSAQFFTHLEQNQIPSLAWDVSPFSDCAPDMLTPVTSPYYGGDANATSWPLSNWGRVVQAYLLNPSAY